MADVVIVGASGLVGSHLVASLRGTRDLVTVSRRPPPGFESTARHHTLDLGMPWSSAELPRTSDAVIFLAQAEFSNGFPEQAESIFAVNTSSVLGMLEYARTSGAETFIFASSGGVYGPGKDARVENNPIIAHGDLSFYLSTKLCSEILVETYSASFNIIILRIFFAYGKGQQPDRLIPRLVGRIRRGEPIYLEGENGISLNPIHVSDVIRSIEASLYLTGSNKINLAGPETYTLRDIGTLIGDRLRLDPVFVVKNPIGPSSLVGDVSIMSRLLGPPVRSLTMGIADVL